MGSVQEWLDLEHSNESKSVRIQHLFNLSFAFI